MKRAGCPAPAALLLAALATACLGPTRYHPTDPMWGPYGYTDLALGAGEHAVTVRANSRTTDASVADMLLLRAAEVTLAARRTHFVVLHRDTGDRYDPVLVMVPVVVAGAIIPVAVGRGVTREKTGHLVMRLCDVGRPPPPMRLGRRRSCARSSGRACRPPTGLLARSRS